MADDKEDELAKVKLEAFQLQCIIDAKDREIMLLRAQIGADAGAMDRAEAAEAENRRLAARIAELEAAAAAPAPGVRGGSVGGGGGGGGAATTRPAPEVLALNVSGVEMWAARSTLLLVPRLAAMFFGGGHDGGDGSGSTVAGGGGGSAPGMPAALPPPPPPVDALGRPFLPYRPAAFAALLGALQEVEAFGAPVGGWPPGLSPSNTSPPPSSYPPPPPSADQDGGPQYMAELLRHLGLERALLAAD